MNEIAIRIAALRDALCDGDNTVLAQRLGKTPQYASALCNGRSNAGIATLENLCRNFPEVSRRWLYFGDGAMLDTTPTTSKTASELLNETASHLAKLSVLVYQLAKSCAKPSA